MRSRKRTIDDLPRIEVALIRLKEAREQLRKAGAHRAADYAQRALKSAQGARNHCYLRLRYSDAELRRPIRREETL